MANAPEIRIDIVSDVVCPWCYIGYRQLERAMRSLADRAEFAVRWHPFQLAPDAPDGGQLLSDYVRERYGATPEQSRGNRDRITQIGASLGIVFNFGEQGRIYNTALAHRLMAWAGEQGGQTALSLALFDAYFTRNADVSDGDVLVAVAASAGLDRDAARTALSDPRYAVEVEQAVRHWIDQNVTGVPAAIVNGGYMVPGAQDADTWVRVFERVIERTAALA